MSWVGLYSRDHDNGRRQLVRDSLDGIAPETALLARGTIVFEIDLSPDSPAPSRLIHYDNDKDWQRQFTVFLNADFSLSVACRQGCLESYVRVSSVRPQNQAKLRVSFSWDAPERFGLLSVENQSEGVIHQVNFADPIPIPLRDASQLYRAGRHVSIDPRVSCIALSDRREPVGPAGGLGTGTPVETTEGFRPIEQLRLGDRVITRNHGVQPVRWVVSQALPACGTSLPFSLRAPYFGLSQDLVVTASQKLVLDGPDTEYHLGRDGVLVEAQALQGHPAVARPSSPLAVTYHQVLFDRHVCMNVAGTWVGSLFIGSLARNPAIVATTLLAPVPPSLLPVHRRMAATPLRRYEAPVLRDVLPA